MMTTNTCYCGFILWTGSWKCSFLASCWKSPTCCGTSSRRSTSPHFSKMKLKSLKWGLKVPHWLRWPSICLSVCLSVGLSVHLSVVYLSSSASLPVCLFVCLSDWSVYLSSGVSKVCCLCQWQQWRAHHRRRSQHVFRPSPSFDHQQTLHLHYLPPDDWQCVACGSSQQPDFTVTSVCSDRLIIRWCSKVIYMLWWYGSMSWFCIRYSQVGLS